MSPPAKAERAAHAQRVCPKCNHNLIARTISPPDLISLMCCACNWKGACLWLDPDPAHTDSIRRENEPEPDVGRLWEKVEALDIAASEAVKGIYAQLHDIREQLGTNDDKTGLSGQVKVLWDRVAALEQPPAPEPVDSSAAVDAADSWWCRELADALHVPVTDGNELLHRLRARLDAYRALHRAAADTKKRDWYRIELGMALHALDQLGVSPDNPPAAIHDDSSLDPPHPVDRCERCGIDLQRLHDDEPTCAELLQLWQRLSNGYGITKPGALAETALKAEEMVRRQAKELLATKEVTEEQRDELNGIRQQLLDAVDGEADATTDELLARVLRRAGTVQQLITTLEPEQLRGVAAGLHGFCSEGHSPGWIVADALDIVATISEEEQD